MPKSPSEYCQSERLFLLYDFLMRNGSPKTIITKREIMEYLADYNISIHDSEFYAWLFNFGRGARIVSPPEFAAKMLDYAEKIVEMYKNNGEM